MTPETIGIIIAAVITALITGPTAGLVSARLTKTALEDNYKNLFFDVSEQLIVLTKSTKATEAELREQTKTVVQQAADLATVTAKAERDSIAFNAKIDLMESQRVEQEKRHTATMDAVISKLAVLEAVNEKLERDLSATKDKLTKTEGWLDMVKDRLNPPPLPERDAKAIEALRDSAPTSDDDALPKTGTEG
jgi:hypothetical protein